MCRDIINLEVKKGNRTYILNVKSSNEPSRGAAKDCNRLVNTVMNRLFSV